MYFYMYIHIPWNKFFLTQNQRVPNKCSENKVKLCPA